jgi:predicted NUDIX family phosphoesterase
MGLSYRFPTERRPDQELIMSDEYVLCVPSSIDLPSGFIPYSKATFFDILRYAVHFRPRSEVETDSGYKQIVTYCMVFSLRLSKDLSIEHGGFLAYQRPHRGSESRLNSLWSIGIGGHVNYVDMLGKLPYLGIEDACRRELVEEINYNDAELKRPIFAGFINDDSNDVGRHHIGIVGMMSFYPGLLQVNPEFPDWSLVTPGQLYEEIDKYESWSQILIRDYLCKG